MNRVYSIFLKYLRLHQRRELELFLIREVFLHKMKVELVQQKILCNTYKNNKIINIFIRKEINMLNQKYKI